MKGIKQFHWFSQRDLFFRRHIFSTHMTFPKGLPYFTEGVVVKGFGRGSKELGCPTANFDEEVINKLPEDIAPGIYYGYANVDKGPVYKMVTCIGWNPFYKNTKKSMETYIINNFDEDFYGKVLKVVMLGYLRPEKNFGNVDELINAINKDIADAKEKLDMEDMVTFKGHDFFYKS